jgi:hypothetical protein
MASTDFADRVTLEISDDQISQKKSKSQSSTNSKKIMKINKKSNPLN